MKIKLVLASGRFKLMTVNSKEDLMKLENENWEYVC